MDTILDHPAVIALQAENERLREVASLLVEELDDPCRVNFQKPFSAVWLSETLRIKARAALGKGERK